MKCKNVSLVDDLGSVSFFLRGDVIYGFTKNDIRTEGWGCLVVICGRRLPGLLLGLLDVGLLLGLLIYLGVVMSLVVLLGGSLPGLLLGLLDVSLLLEDWGRLLLVNIGASLNKRLVSTLRRRVVLERNHEQEHTDHGVTTVADQRSKEEEAVESVNILNLIKSTVLELVPNIANESYHVAANSDKRTNLARTHLLTRQKLRWVSSKASDSPVNKSHCSNLACKEDGVAHKGHPVISWVIRAWFSNC
jgi:hypothetical protein